VKKRALAVLCRRTDIIIIVVKTFVDKLECRGASFKGVIVLPEKFENAETFPNLRGGGTPTFKGHLVSIL
jgi:hypothetical protein